MKSADRKLDGSEIAGGPPALYIVATPIGNLEDITLRALRVLKEVDVIACEDTRQTQKLLNHYGIATRTISYHQHNEATRAAELVKDLQQGASVALVTDAGMPGISDPGFRLISLAIQHQVNVVPIPGATGPTAGSPCGFGASGIDCCCGAALCPAVCCAGCPSIMHTKAPANTLFLTTKPPYVPARSFRPEALPTNRLPVLHRCRHLF